jgi:nitrite reductase/ring-hydroxylating ferredoxin subunit
MDTIRVAAVGDLPPGKGRVLEVGNRQVTIYNIEGRFHATCSRRGRATHGMPTHTDCSAHGLAFEVFAEDSPAHLRADEQACRVRVVEETVWLELPEE